MKQGGSVSGSGILKDKKSTVSDVSTDWEYDKKKSSWQTLGLTRSEIEYQNKKNGSVPNS